MLSGGLRGERMPLPLLSPRGHLHSLVHSFLLHLQSHQYFICLCLSAIVISVSDSPLSSLFSIFKHLYDYIGPIIYNPGPIIFQVRFKDQMISKLNSPFQYNPTYSQVQGFHMSIFGGAIILPNTLLLLLRLPMI